MERENIIAATKQRLKEFKLGDLNHYKETTMEQFITIEQYFLKTEARINKAFKEINSVKLKIRTICREINISKSTVYNNPNTLLLYIEQRIGCFEKQDLFSKNKQVKAQERISDLEDFIDKAIIDQIEFNNLKVQNEYLQDEVHRLSEKNEVFSLERAQLVKKLNEMDQELRRLRNKSGTVVGIDWEKE